MYTFLEFCEVVIVYTLLNVLIITNHRKHPPFVEKGEKGKKNPECYIVSVWYQLGKMGHNYHQYKFVKRKNGKYRLKFYPVLECFVGVLFLRFYIWVMKWDLLLEYPETILPSLVLLLVLLDLFFVFDNAPIVARICFHKYMKTHIKGKRR